MKALMCKQWGVPSSLVLEEVSPRAPAEGQARIAVHACGVNFLDSLMIAGQYQTRPPLPFAPGVEIAGEVIEVGQGVTHIKPGDRVMGAVEYGGYAEEITASAVTLLLIPPGMDYVTAAAFPLAYGTSHVALTHRAHLQAGETLLVFGAAGGVGLAAVEIGKLLGATVIACASTPEKLRLTQEYGADHVINYSTESIRDQVKKITGGKGADVIYDPVGGDAFDQAVRSINWQGRLLVIGFTSGRIPELPVNLTLVKNFSVVGVYWGAYAARSPGILIDSFRTLAVWYAEGKLKPHISATYSLANAADAMYRLMNRQSTGKIVIRMDAG